MAENFFFRFEEKNEKSCTNFFCFLVRIHYSAIQRAAEWIWNLLTPSAPNSALPDNKSKMILVFSVYANKKAVNKLAAPYNHVEQQCQKILQKSKRQKCFWKNFETKNSWLIYN